MKGGITPGRLRNGKRAQPKQPGGIVPDLVGVGPAMARADALNINRFIGGDSTELGTALEHGTTSPQLDESNPDQLQPGAPQRFGPHFPVLPFAWSITDLVTETDADLFAKQQLPPGRLYLDDLLVVVESSKKTLVFYVGSRDFANPRITDIGNDFFNNLGTEAQRAIFWAGVIDDDFSVLLPMPRGVVEVLSPEQTLRVFNASRDDFGLAGVAYFSRG